MSIFSRIGSAISSVGRSIGNTIGNALTGRNNTAAVGNASSNIGSSVASIYNNAGVSSSNRTINAVSVPSSVGPVNSPSYNAFIASNPQGTQITSSYGNGPWSSTTPLPVSISSGQQKTSGGSVLGASTSASSYYSGYTSPTSISRSSLSAGGAASLSAGAGFSQPMAVPSSPTSTNPNGLDTTGLAGTMAGYYTRKEDGTFEPAKQDPFAEKSDQQIIAERAKAYKEAFGESQNEYNDPQVQEAQANRRRIQEALLAPTNELNAIVAKEKQDLLQLRQTGSQEGVTEAVYGGQSNAISYNAAIRALPLQANIAALQGNLELADSYLNELVTMKKSQIKTQYDYNKGLFDTIYTALDAKEKRVADRMIKENDRQYKSENELIDYKAEMVKMANSQKAPSYVITAIERATNKVDAAKAAGKYGTTAVATTNQSTDNERALMTQFRNEPIVKDFNTILVQKGTIDNYIQNGVGGPADLATVFSFMKGLDPTSVVRETEYANAAKSGNIFQGAWSKFNGYFKEKGGILPASVRQEFQNLVNQRLAAQKSAYDNLASQYTGIAQRQGLNPTNVVIDYASGGQKTSSAAPNVSTTKSGKPFDVQSALNSGYTQAEVQAYLNSH